MFKGNLRYWIVTLVAIATVINYIDRGALGFLWPEISKELELTEYDYAIILNVFTFAYAFGQSIFGKIFDWIGTRLGFVLSIVVWSAATALHAFAQGLLSFALFRAVLGVSEAGNWPGATKANAEWFPINERALAQGIFNSGAAIGGIVSAPIIGLLFVFLGSWQATFVAIAALGFLWLIPWLIVYKSGPEAHPWISQEEREYILTGQRNVETNQVADYAPDTKEILSRKESWGVILASFFLDPIWWLFVGWLPIYLLNTYGFGVEEIAVYAWIPYVGAMFGAWFGGLLAGNRLKAGWTVNRTRKTIIGLGGLIMLVSLLATTQASTPLVAVLIMAVILFGFQTAVGNIQTLPSDFYSGKSVGSLAGFAGTAAKLAVVLLNFLIPVITVNSYTPAFLVGAGLAIMTVLSVLIFCPDIKPLKPKTS
ncbi:MFS transporter [Altererythrobacter sp.]|uniref:MFS transporter n=1 Tax=Altererythrobacter sp. TaxID=1872480 RepID=UPI001B0677CF|nr:MFS transporter [Altererythrobacter sp.]MBO6610126.1 MFS transporter [Altererythrobacter sp.]MBO6641877.1 MFS transporter [Altererythrobacter sp.]MBO6709865.1 MFS transporter [Altererythrobacter sp.]MBO6944278.1 MFS transporter [Altererythrobacter sp.]